MTLIKLRHKLRYIQLTFFFSKGQSHLEVLVTKRIPIANEQTFVGRRIVYKLDLNSIFTEKSPVMGFNASVVRTSSSPNFKRPVNFVIDNSNIYFLTSVNRPSILKVNVYLNSTLKPTQDLRKYTKVFIAKESRARKTHVFKLRSSNSLEEILKSEKAILENFESQLWKSSKPCKDCLSISYIVPNKNEYEIGVASSQPHSDLLNEFCFLGEIPAEYLKIANFTVNRQDVRCESIKVARHHPIEYYVVNAFITVNASPVTLTRTIPDWMLMG